MDAVRRIADAVLYEGYVLWPYRRSALKNQRRWTFGGVHPAAHSAVHPDDSAVMQTQCLVEAPADARLDVRVRFLHVVERTVARLGENGLEPVDALAVGDERHVAWEEATEREIRTPEMGLQALGSPARVEIDVPAGRNEEELQDAHGRGVGALVRSWRALEGAVEVTAAQLAEALFRLTVRVSNTSPFEGDGREEALKQTFCSTHTILEIHGGEFVSLTDCPERLRSEVELCDNVGTWPVLAGNAGERHTVLSSPIILSDYPEVAPESPGDLFDGGEVDQLLTLSILSMTDEEKRQMRESDPRTREILARTESLSREELMRLHGTIREFGPVQPR